MDGFLLVDKPVGISSFRVVAIVRRILSEQAGKRVKVGHTGTLDPAASGLMILVVGSFTKRAAVFSKLDKSYQTELTLGAVSTTGDVEGEITAFSSKEPTKSEVEAVLAHFQGEITQVPPIHSAVKINGQRAYKLARAGKEVQIQPRQVTIHSIEEVTYAYPKLAFTVSVTSGTYVRSLGQDIGDRLGTGAYVSGLRRLSVGQFHIGEAIKPDEASDERLLKLQ
jgi:tRNA pseudouridine55 synthase